MTLDQLVEQAQQGDRAALESVIEQIQDRVYNLALRFLWHPADAEDATQEILVRIVTHLGSFRGDSQFTTWVYQVAANHLRTTRKRRLEQAKLSFDEFASSSRKSRSAVPTPCSFVWTATIASPTSSARSSRSPAAKPPASSKSPPRPSASDCRAPAPASSDSCGASVASSTRTTPAAAPAA